MKRFFKIFGAGIGILAILLLILYFYVINNAENLIKEFVERQSDGKLSLVIKKVEFNPRQLHLTLIQPHFYSNDTLTEPTTYDIKANSLVLQLTALRPLIFQRKIYLDTMACMRPQITSTKWKDQQSKGNFSLAEQMGLVYSKLNVVMNTLNIKYCLIDSGSFTLVDKVKKDAKPITITDYYLRIDNFKKDTSAGKDSRYLYSDRIKFYSSHQDIVFPDGKHGIKYSRLRINSFKHSIEIDSCFIYGKNGGSGYNEFGVFFDTLRLTNADFKQLTLLNLIKADSALCINPEVRVKMELNEKTKQAKTKRVALSKDSIEIVIKELLGDIDIRYLSVSNAYLSLQTKSNDKITDYQTRKSNFIMEDIMIIKDPAIPLRVGSFYLGLHQYQAHNPDSTYSISFDSILFRNSKINLSNFAIIPTVKNQNYTDRKEIRMASLEIRKISWLDLIMNKNFIAGEVTLISPEINIHTPEKKQTQKVAQRSFFSTFQGIDDQVTIDRLNIENANINFYSANKNHLRLEKVNTVLSINELLDAGSINDLAGSVNIISFKGGTYNTGNSFVKLNDGVINGQDKTIVISAVRVSAKGGKSTAVLKDIRIANFRQVQNDLFDIGNLSWQKADILLHPATKKINTGGNKSSPVRVFQLILDQLDGKNTTILMQSENMNAKVNFDWLKTNQIDWDGNGIPEIKNLQVKGNTLRVKKNTLDLGIGEFMAGDGQASFLHQLNLTTIGKKDSIFLSSPNLTFLPDLQSIISGNPKIGNVVIHDPVIRMLTTGDTVKAIAKQKKGKLPKLVINQLSIINPVIFNLPDNRDQKIDLSKQKSEWSFSRINSASNLFTVDRISVTASGFSADTKKVSFSIKEKGKLSVGISNLKYSPTTETAITEWSAMINTVSARDVELTTHKNDSSASNINLQSFDLENLSLKSGEKLSLSNLLSSKREFQIKNVDLSMVSNNNNLRVNGLAYNHQLRSISLDSLAFRPVLDRDSFNIVNTWAKDHISFRTGKTIFSGVDPELYLNDTVFLLKNIETNQPTLQVYKDKRLPYSGISSYKPLPTYLLQQLGKKIKVDSIKLNNADITYEELNGKTGLLGRVHFGGTKALVMGIKTYDYYPTDSLRILVTSRFMDSANLRLNFNQSYTDTLHGFLMGLRVGAFNMMALNPLLEPLVSVKINRGWLDTLHMNAIGREYIAHGKMKLYYRNLNASYLDKKDAKKKTFLTRFISFFANSFVIKTNNQRGYNQVYVERNREKSIINYWIKMVTSGAITGTRLKSNKGQVKKYSKSVKRLKVPELPEVEL